MSGGGNYQIRPKRDNLLTDVGVGDMVCRWGVHYPKLCARCPSHITGIGAGSKGNVGNTVRGPHRKA